MSFQEISREDGVFCQKINIINSHIPPSLSLSLSLSLPFVGKTKIIIIHLSVIPKDGGSNNETVGNIK